MESEVLYICVGRYAPYVCTVSYRYYELLPIRIVSPAGRWATTLMQPIIIIRTIKTTTFFILNPFFASGKKCRLSFVVFQYSNTAVFESADFCLGKRQPRRVASPLRYRKSPLDSFFTPKHTFGNIRCPLSKRAKA